MNHKFAALLLLMLPLCANGALSTSGFWGDYDVSGTEEVTLDGDVGMWNVVRIPKGSKLIIHGNGHKINIRNFNFTVTEDNSGTGSCYSFDVRGELEIYGPITLDGGNTLDFGYVGGGGEPSTFKSEKMNGNYYNGRETGETNSANVIIVHNCGAKLTIDNATFQNVRSHLTIPPVVAFTDDYAFMDGIWQYSDGAHTRAAITATFTNVNFNNCLDDTGQGIIKFHNQVQGNATFDNCTFSRCAVYDYGGVVKGFGGGNTNNIKVTMNGCTFHHCLSYGWGGAILWATAPTNESKLMLNNCTFYENYARGVGGAISNEGTTELANSTIENNYAGLGGGGIASFPFSLAESGTSSSNGLVLLSGNKIRNNRSKETEATGSPFGNSIPSGGGGIWIYNAKDWEVDATIGTGNEVTGNISAYNGGGVAIGASASSSLPMVTIDGGTISDNTATTGNGGGVYMPGGVLTIKSGTISGNIAASGNGGGFSITNGTVKITGNTEITYNNCARYGAGLYVNNNASEQVATEFYGGTIKENGLTACLAGGGICVDGNVKFSTTSTLEGNQAKNGGGICVIGGADMTYKSGLIRNNKAVSESTYSTGYKKSETEIEGFGGGVFVAGSNSNLTFDMSDVSFGLYGNAAENGADDIFANGNGTSVTVPDVSGMTLSEFNVPVPENSLFWAEDYATNDPNYGYGTKIDTGWTDSNVRYRYALNNMLEPFKVPAQTLTNYTSLALGYGVVYVTIKKEGLNEGESAIFEITKEEAEEPYMRLLVTGDSTNSVSQTVALFPGTWTIKETNWSWTYSNDRPDGITKTIGNDSTPEQKTFKFVNSKKSNLTPNSESIYKNTF
ncbi:MAG: hypothetical protein ACI31A_00360 [Candidatus Limisoma sp.]